MTCKVLIADDHPLFRDALNSIVHMAIEDCEVRQATDYREAAKALDNNLTSNLTSNLTRTPTTKLEKYRLT